MMDGGETDGATDRDSARLNAQIARQVRALRAERALSLEALAGASGVSRSMISLIERGETSATAVVLARLATGLGVTLAALLEAPQPAAAAGGPLSRHEGQPLWRDPASGYMRRSVSPPAARQPLHIAEVRFPAGARVAFDNGGRDLTIFQQVWMLEGTMDVTADGRRHRLRRGDCLAMQLDAPTMFHNPTRRASRYAVVTAADRPRAR